MFSPTIHRGYSGAFLAAKIGSFNNDIPLGGIVSNPCLKRRNHRGSTGGNEYQKLQDNVAIVVPSLLSIFGIRAGFAGATDGCCCSQQERLKQLMVHEEVALSGFDETV